jgi:hypothetical protein
VILTQRLRFGALTAYFAKIQVLNVSPQYVSKWKGQYEAEGVAARQLGYRGSEG